MSSIEFPDHVVYCILRHSDPLELRSWSRCDKRTLDTVKRVFQELDPMTRGDLRTLWKAPPGFWRIGQNFLDCISKGWLQCARKFPSSAVIFSSKTFYDAALKSGNPAIFCHLLNCRRIAVKTDAPVNDLMFSACFAGQPAMVACIWRELGRPMLGIDETIDPPIFERLLLHAAASGSAALLQWLQKEFSVLFQSIPWNFKSDGIKLTQRMLTAACTDPRCNLDVVRWICEQTGPVPSRTFDHEFFQELCVPLHRLSKAVKPLYPSEQRSITLQSRCENPREDENVSCAILQYIFSTNKIAPSAILPLFVAQNMLADENSIFLRTIQACRFRVATLLANFLELLPPLSSVATAASSTSSVTSTSAPLASVGADRKKLFCVDNCLHPRVAGNVVHALHPSLTRLLVNTYDSVDYQFLERFIGACGAEARASWSNFVFNTRWETLMQAQEQWLQFLLNLFTPSAAQLERVFLQALALQRKTYNEMGIYKTFRPVVDEQRRERNRMRKQETVVRIDRFLGEWSTKVLPVQACWLEYTSTGSASSVWNNVGEIVNQEKDAPVRGDGDEEDDWSGETEIKTEKIRSECHNALADLLWEIFSESEVEEEWKERANLVFRVYSLHRRLRVVTQRIYADWEAAYFVRLMFHRRAMTKFVEKISVPITLPHAITTDDSTTTNSGREAVATNEPVVSMENSVIRAKETTKDKQNPAIVQCPCEFKTEWKALLMERTELYIMKRVLDNFLTLVARGLKKQERLHTLYASWDKESVVAQLKKWSCEKCSRKRKIDFPRLVSSPTKIVKLNSNMQ
jgi:hypothetical protein